MAVGFYYCCDFLYTAAAAWLMLTLAGAVWKPRVGRRARGMIWAVAVVVVAGVNTANDSMISTLFSWTALMINVLLVSLANTLACRCKYRDAFYLIYVSWTTLALADFFLQTFVYTIKDGMGGQKDVLLTATVPRGIYLLIWATVLLAAAGFVRRRVKGMRMEALRYLKKKWLLVPILLLTTIYFQRIYSQAGLEQLPYHWLLFLAGGMLLVLAGLAYIAVNRERERYCLLQQKAEMLEYEYRVMKEGKQERGILLHDIRKHGMAIREMAEAGRVQDIVRYLDEMEMEMGRKPQKARSRDLVNHELLNLILNRKIQEAEGLGITVRYDFDDMDSLQLTPMEICALFSNILDNAIEAAQALEEEGERWINLGCTRKGRMLIVSESNPMPERKLRFVEGIPQTTKKDKWNHGLGMQSIGRIVELHGGHMQIDAKGGIYQLIAFLEGFHEDAD